MTGGVVICAEGLGKKYNIGSQAESERNPTLRDVIARGARVLARSAADTLRGRPLVTGDQVGEFWALKDISFEVKRGEVVGIIGRNGAGKSTLLKILSRITEPSTGRVTIKGRVASLLEVGTGFHPELTGRENIYLNGAILGMARAEIRRKFDEIVAFAEVEKFLDTPVKRYSSGMYVRLAFAVAAHLEPEILVVDEVLAVGDAEFQRKCLGKMGEVAANGRTVLFVSHNLDAVANLCAHGVVLDSGRITFMSTAAEAVRNYLRNMRHHSGLLADYREPRFATTSEFLAAQTASIDGTPKSIFAQGEPFQIWVTVMAKTPSPRELAVVVENHESRALFTTHLSDKSPHLTSTGITTFVIKIFEPALRNGDYLVSLASASADLREFFDIVLHLPLFTVVGEVRKFPTDRRWGDLYFPLEWTIRHSDAQLPATLPATRAAVLTR